MRAYLFLQMFPHLHPPTCMARGFHILTDIWYCELSSQPSGPRQTSFIMALIWISPNTLNNFMCLQANLDILLCEDNVLYLYLDRGYPWIFTHPPYKTLRQMFCKNLSPSVSRPFLFLIVFYLQQYWPFLSWLYLLEICETPAWPNHRIIHAFSYSHMISTLCLNIS